MESEESIAQDTSPKEVERACISGQVTRYVEVNGVLHRVAPDGQMIPRQVIQVYHKGFIREAYSDTMELLPCENPVPFPGPNYVPPEKRRRSQRNKKPRKGSLLQRLIDRDKGCVLCRTQHTLTRHHVVHKSRGGLATIENLQTLCRRCHDHVHHTLRIPSGVHVTPELNVLPYITKEKRRSLAADDKAKRNAAIAARVEAKSHANLAEWSAPVDRRWWYTEGRAQADAAYASWLGA